MKMNFLSRLRRTISPGQRWVGAFLLFFLAGCGREDIRVYTVPKEKPAAPRMAQNAGTVKPRPQLSWKLPQGWRESGPGKMSLASFSITGPSGQEAQVAITPLTVLAGRETQIVNMWREQVGLDPLSDEEAARQLQTVEVGGEKGSLFEIVGKPKGGVEPVRIITAMVHRPDASWFYKLSGDADLVESQKPTFIEFLKSVQIKEAAPVEMASTDTLSKASWKIPSGWKPLPVGQMQVAKFAVPERGAAKAEVFVSVFENDTGGKLANVNRWRKQIGLGEVGETDLPALVSPLDASHPDAMLIDMTNNNRQLVGAIVPREGSFWFYKLLGDAAAVAPEKEVFLAFAKSKP